MTRRLIAFVLVAASSVAAASPTFSASPNPADFSGVPVGVMSMPLAITITNAGNATLHIKSFAITGADAGDFTSSDPIKPPLSLNQGVTFPFHVVFTPSRMGPESAAVTLGTDDPNQLTATITLTGSGTAPQVSVMPGFLDFGAIPAGSQAMPQVITLVNSGGAPAMIKAITVGGNDASQFSVDSKGPLPVAANGMATVHAKFAPSMVGTFMATVSFDAGGTTLMVALTGMATAPALMASTATIDFGWVGVGTTSDPQTVALKNSGMVPVVISAITSTDPQFVVDMSHTATQVAPQTVTTFAVSYRPSKLGDGTAQINVGIKGVPMAAQLVATGTGVTPAQDLGTGPPPDLHGGDLAGADLAGADLAGGPPTIFRHGGACTVGGARGGGGATALLLGLAAALALLRRRRR